MAYFHYVSDVHLEFAPYSLADHVNKKNRRFPELADEADEVPIVLLLAGDICPLRLENKFRRFLSEASELYDDVVIVPGNHEYYLSESMAFVEQTMKAIAASFPNVHVLLKETIVLHGIKIIGATLWSHVPEELKQSTNDHRQIVELTRARYNELHEEHRLWLESELKVNHDLEDNLDDKEEDTGPVVVMTHYLPSEKLVHPLYQGHPLTPYFASACDRLLKLPRFSVWVYGHTHMGSKQVVNGTLCVCNPRGYPGEHGCDKEAYFHVFV